MNSGTLTHDWKIYLKPLMRFNMLHNILLQGSWLRFGTWIRRTYYIDTSHNIKSRNTKTDINIQGSEA
ncbi:hypothetical protein SCA6_014026 [Theobroma cacao]